MGLFRLRIMPPFRTGIPFFRARSRHRGYRKEHGSANYLLAACISNKNGIIALRPFPDIRALPARPRLHTAGNMVQNAFSPRLYSFAFAAVWKTIHTASRNWIRHLAMDFFIFPGTVGRPVSWDAAGRRISSIPERSIAGVRIRAKAIGTVFALSPALGNRSIQQQNRVHK